MAPAQKMQRNLLCQKEGFPLRVCQKKGGGLDQGSVEKRGIARTFCQKKWGFHWGGSVKKRRLQLGSVKKKWNCTDAMSKKRVFQKGSDPKRWGFHWKVKKKSCFLWSSGIIKWYERCIRYTYSYLGVEPSLRTFKFLVYPHNYWDV